MRRALAIITDEGAASRRRAQEANPIERPTRLGPRHQFDVAHAQRLGQVAKRDDGRVAWPFSTLLMHRWLKSDPAIAMRYGKSITKGT